MKPLLVLLVIGIAACTRGDPEVATPPAADPALEAGQAAPTPEEQAQQIAGDPRMLLFDLQTALQGIHQTSGRYPTTTEFQLEEQWSFPRAALDAAFSSWRYESDGSAYQFTGESQGKRFEVSSPS